MQLQKKRSFQVITKFRMIFLIVHCETPGRRSQRRKRRHTVTSRSRSRCFPGRRNSPNRFQSETFPIQRDMNTVRGSLHMTPDDMTLISGDMRMVEENEVPISNPGTRLLSGMNPAPNEKLIRNDRSKIHSCTHRSPDDMSLIRNYLRTMLIDVHLLQHDIRPIANVLTVILNRWVLLHPRRQPPASQRLRKKRKSVHSIDSTCPRVGAMVN